MQALYITKPRRKKNTLLTLHDRYSSFVIFYIATARARFDTQTEKHARTRKNGKFTFLAAAYTAEVQRYITDGVYALLNRARISKSRVCGLNGLSRGASRYGTFSLFFFFILSSICIIEGKAARVLYTREDLFSLCAKVRPLITLRRKFSSKRVRSLSGQF